MTVEGFEKYPYVVGIQFGGITSSVSLAHKNDSLNIRTVEWERKSKCTQVPTSIFYKGGNIQDKESILFGLEISEDENMVLENGDVYLQHIKEYIFDTVRANTMLNTKARGLNIQMAVADYLKKLHDGAIAKLTKKLKKADPNTDFKADNCRYILVCPKSQIWLMRECFIQAGIVAEEEIDYRLDFTTESEASAYNCIAWDRKTSDISGGLHYLVCDIGHTSLGISRILADTTESLSKVEFVAEYDGIGSKALENNLKSYLNIEENIERLKLDQATVERVMKEFTEDVKFSFDVPLTDSLAFSTSNVDGDPINITHDDLIREVFSPAINKIIERILEADATAVENHNISYKKIFLTGKYSTTPHFAQKFSEAKDGILQITDWIEYHNTESVSRGAVAHGFRKKQSQIPYFTKESANNVSVVTNDPIEKNAPRFNECDFIVGIDFGTTYSGSSYVRPAREGDTKLEEIKPIISGWPGQTQNNQVEKAPTLIIYNEKKGEILPLWGQKAKEKELRSHEQLFGKFKLFLSPKTVDKYYGKGNVDIREIKDKFTLGSVSAEKVIADYLKYFKAHVEKHIRAKEGKRGFLGIKENLTLSYVLTVPAMWDKTAKDTMVSAAIEAGIATKNQLQNLLIITEPEAAALYCERHYKDFPKKDGMTFIVCDAGGGTVDLVTFRLNIDEKTGEEIIHQVGRGEGDTCGSTYLDANFRKYILDFYTDIEVQYDEVKLNLSGLMDRFIDKLKPDFKPCPDRDLYYKIHLPYYPAIPENVNTKGRTEERNRVLRISNKDMKEKIFDPIMKRIEDLLDTQIKKMREDKKIDTILLVGGFSKSRYLQDRLRRRYEPNITIGIPANAVTAISQGAVSYAQRPRMISKTLVGQSYALEVKTEYDKSKGDFIEKLVTSAEGLEYSESRLEYFTRKNDKIDQDKTTAFEKVVYIEYPNNAVIAIFSCNKVVEDTTKYRYVNKDLHAKIMEVNVDMPYLPNKSKNDKIQFKIRLQLDHIGVTVSVVCTEKEITTAEGTAIVESLKYVRKSEPVVYKSKLPTSGFVL